LKKKIFLSLLVVIALLTFCSATTARETVRIVVNGSFINSDVPPQIINGRTMVPIRFIAEALDCEVTWIESTRIVFINDKPKTLKPPIIKGTDEFIEVIEGVLELAKEKDVELYNWYISNCDIIELGDANNHIACNFMNIYTKEAIITFDEHYFNIAKSKYSKHDLLLLYVGILAHECEHTPNYFNYIYTDSDIEVLCCLASVRAFQKVGGRNSEFEKYFIDSVYDQLKL